NRLQCAGRAVSNRQHHAGVIGRTNMTRRKFLQSSAAIALAASNVRAGETTKPAPSTAASTQPRRLNIAIIGAGGRGFDHVREINALESANVIALCDVDVNSMVAAAR